MSPALSVAASLSPDIRQDIGIQAIAHTEPISHIDEISDLGRLDDGLLWAASVALNQRFLNHAHKA